jgi:putative oxidoreductase
MGVMPDWSGQYLLRRSIYVLAAAMAAGLVSGAARGVPLVDRRYRETAFARSDSLPETDGIHLIGISAARIFMERGTGKVLDARSPELYAAGHLPGAIDCYVYDSDRFLPPVLKAAPLSEPLMVYCNGEDCEDSRFLAQSLQELGYRRIYIYTGGFGEWSRLGLPVTAGGDSTAVPVSLDLRSLTDPGRLLPSAVWLWADLLILVCGLAVFFLLLRTGGGGAVRWGVRFVGLVFIAASLHKIAAAQEFGRVIENYRIVPWFAINFIALILPWVELFCGLLLVTGVFRPAASLIVLGLTAVFILSVGFNMIRGLEFDCGCFGSVHTPPWRILVRDAGLFLLCLPGLTGRGGWTNKKRRIA